MKTMKKKKYWGGGFGTSTPGLKGDYQDDYELNGTKYASQRSVPYYMQQTLPQHTPIPTVTLPAAGTPTSAPKTGSALKNALKFTPGTSDVDENEYKFSSTTPTPAMIGDTTYPTPPTLGQYNKDGKNFASTKGPTDLSTQGTGSGGLPWSKGEKWGTAIAGAGTLAQLGMALQKADKEKFRANPYAGNILANLPQNMDLRPLHQQIDRNMNTSRAYIDEGTSSQAVRRANILGLGANASNQKSQLGVQEQQFNNQARVQRAQIFDGLGESDRRTRLLIDDQNARNKGQRLTNISSALKDVSTFGVNTANIGTFKTGQNINFAFVNSLSSKYKIDMKDIANIIQSERPKSAEELEKSIIKFKG